ncbi:hypothetical protein CYY_003538 [Polysphondylium violaceum]|uniref:Uncharacterized protein n=1 Tax=Polysphondylium violaceum TaxID=133409 RepID=A0A8J4V117_9MYCE|nr:hypothetical protein CYY_003538 [Polysphondylium violaceum]
MKIGSGRLKWSKLPTPPDAPSTSPSNNGGGASPTTGKVGSASSKSSPHLVAVESSQYGLGSSSSVNNSPTLASISASQSKSSSSLLQKQKWVSGGTLEGGSEDIYELLAEQKLTDEYIWGGHPQLFPILFQYKDKIQQNSQVTGHVLSIVLPDMSEFGDVKKRTYKIGKKLTVQQTVNLICKKQQVKEPRRFWLSTLMGCILNDDLLLSYYGFGTFFDSWELKLIPKEIYTSHIQTDLPLDNFGEYIIDFDLPPLKQFGGLKKKRIKVDSTSTITQIIESICNKYKIEDSNRFSIITNEEFPVVLNNQSTLSHYGLGTLFNSWELNIVFTEFIPPYSLKSQTIPTYGGFYVGKVSHTQTKAAIIDIENKLQTSLKLNEEMVANIKQMANDIKEKDKEIKDKEQQHFTVMNHIEERLTKLKQSVTVERENHNKLILELKEEKDGLVDQIQSLKNQIEEINTTLFKERSSNAESTIQFNFQIANLEKDIESLSEKNTEFESNLADAEQRFEKLSLERNEQEIQHREQIYQKEKERIEMKSFYESNIQKINHEYQEKIGKIIQEHEQQEKEQEEISNRIYDSISSIDNSSSSAAIVGIESIKITSLEDDLVHSNFEREELLLNVKRLNQEIADRDVIIKTVYPKKIQTLENNSKKLEAKLAQVEKENLLDKQTIAIQSLEIQELKRQIENLKTQKQELFTTNETNLSLYKEEEKKTKKLLYDQATLKNELEAERINRENLNKTIVDLESAKMALEISFKQREAQLLEEIEELKKPKPPPLPTFTVKNLAKSPTNDDGISSEINAAKSSLKPVQYVPPPPREHTIATVADILFVSMQKRFQSIQGGDIEDLDDDDDDFNDFD